MKGLLYLLIGVMPLFCALGQSGMETNYILTKEQITIKGRTNINKFECKLDLVGYAMDSLKISVSKVNGDFSFSGLGLSIPVEAFNCKYRLMTSEFRDLLKAKEFPHLNLNIAHAEHVELNRMHMNMLLSVTDKERQELIEDCYVEDKGEELRMGGNHRIYLRSYEIEPPRKFFGTVVVKNELDISFEVTLTRENKSEPR